MDGFVVFIVIAMIAWLISALSKGGASYNRVLKSGIPARGILLNVSAMTQQAVGTGFSKLQRRLVRIDVEIPGQAPYEASMTALIPLNLINDIVPGATVEVRVDPKNRANVVIVGPGTGFSAAALQTGGPS
ncbi:MAG: hypothetical protein QM831_37025 [Kofleriaceae bacterium]